MKTNPEMNQSNHETVRPSQSDLEHFASSPHCACPVCCAVTRNVQDKILSRSEEPPRELREQHAGVPGCACKKCSSSPRTSSQCHPAWKEAPHTTTDDSSVHPQALRKARIAHAVATALWEEWRRRRRGSEVAWMRLGNRLFDAQQEAFARYAELLSASKAAPAKPLSPTPTLPCSFDPDGHLHREALRAAYDWHEYKNCVPELRDVMKCWECAKAIPPDHYAKPGTAGLCLACLKSGSPK